MIRYMYPSSKTIGCQWVSLTFCSFVNFSLRKVNKEYRCKEYCKEYFYVELNPFRGLGGSRHDEKVLL